MSPTDEHLGVGGYSRDVDSELQERGELWVDVRRARWLAREMYGWTESVRSHEEALELRMGGKLSADVGGDR